MKTARLKVVLAEVTPAAIRVIDVPSATSLPELHELLQAAMGWTDSHLHQFVTPEGTTYGTVQPDDWDMLPGQRDENHACLADLGASFTYLYDFGDNWTHEVSVLGAGDAEPGCIYGEGACPPEDVGGPHGYTHLLDTLADPHHDDHDQMRQWVANRLRPFDLATTNRWIRDVVGEVPASVRTLLDLTSEGVRLTPAGRLPRTIVRAMQQLRPHWHLTGRLAATEDGLWPLGELHHYLRTVGLLKLRHGVLTPTKAATSDDLAVVRRLRSGFDPRTFTTQLTDLTIGALAGHGPATPTQLTQQVFPLLDHRWATSDGRPVTERDITLAITHQAPLWECLDLINTSSPTWTAGPSARSLLPAATMLAEIWFTPDTATTPG